MSRYCAVQARVLEINKYRRFMDILECLCCCTHNPKDSLHIVGFHN